MNIDTGQLSLIIALFFIFISLLGVFIVVYMIKNKKIENENIDRIVEIGKWFIVSVAITLSASIINDGFKEREQDVKEMEVFDKYVSTIIMADNLEQRRALCEYFAAVSPNGQIKKSWQDYQKIVDKQLQNAAALKAKIADIENKELDQAATAEELIKKEELINKIQANNMSLSPLIKKDTATAIKSRVYIHINDETQLPEMKKLQHSLQDNGFAVPGIENVKYKANIPKIASVRYFNVEDKDGAQLVVDKLKEFGEANATLVYITSYSARLGHLEVWLGNKDKT